MISLQALLTCSKCASESLDFSDLEERDGLPFAGSIRCPACGSVITVDRGVLVCVDSASLSKIDQRNQVVYKEIWSRGYESYKEENVTEESRLLVDWRKSFAVDVLLDAGSGAGRLLGTWADSNAGTVVFVDVSDAIHQCRDNFLQSGPHTFDAVFIRASIKDLPLKNRVVDTTWCSGTIACTDNQEAVLQELLRVTNRTLLLGTITEKTFTGRVYLHANAVRPLIRMIKNMDIVFRLAGILAFFAWAAIKILCRLGSWFKADAWRDLTKVVERDQAIARLQYTLFDPLAAPTARKYRDEFYVDLAAHGGFELKRQTTSSVCDYYEFVAAEKWPAADPDDSHTAASCPTTSASSPARRARATR